MARPQQFDNEALLESMRDTFLDLGPGASTQELAKRAGVSEGTLYKRFVSKRRMFTEALRLPEVEDFDWFTGMEARIGVLPIAEHLVSIAHRDARLRQRAAPLLADDRRQRQAQAQDFAQLLGDDEEAPPFVVIKAITSSSSARWRSGACGSVTPRARAPLPRGAHSRRAPANALPRPHA
jgi:AcrR family transcriptional regulator